MATSIAKYRGHTALLVVAAAMVVLAVSLAAIARNPGFIPVSSNRTVGIEINDLRPGDVRFFTYGDRAGDQVKFLLARDAIGRVKAAFDACQRCYIYHKGYFSSHGDLVCKFCGNRYRLEAMESGLASCISIKLPFQTAGQTVIIKSADLERAHGLFQN